MSSSTAIGRVSESLRELLLGEMTLTPQVPVTILAPDEGGGARRINLFLYHVRENPYLRNADWQVNENDTSQLLPPPLSLNLYYLMTPFADNDTNLGNVSAHEILGDAMRVFAEYSIVPQGYLAGDLLGAPEQLRIVRDDVNLEELSSVWATFQQPFRLSVMYEVSVVQLEQEGGQRELPTRVGSIGVSAGADYVTPAVDAMTPTSLVAGQDLTFSGRHLAGWNAGVRILGADVVIQQQLTANSFTATVPNSLVPGLYQVRVDVGNVYRTTFLLEVTA